MDFTRAHLLLQGACLVSLVGGGCGNQISAQTIHADSTDDTHLNDKSDIVTSGTKADVVKISSPSFLYSLRESGASCHGLFISETVFISPKHCFTKATSGNKVDLKIDSKVFQATFHALLPAPSFEVEETAMLQFENLRFRTDRFADPRSFEFPEKVQPPFPLEIYRIGSQSPLVCSPLRYNLGGLIAYDCPTTGSMSGAVLISKDSKPFAIHIGRKSGLGYALVLGSIKNEILGALAKSGGPDTGVLR